MRGFSFLLAIFAPSKMFLTRTYYIFFSLIFFYSSDLYSQGNKFIRFSNLGIGEGLSQSSVFSIIQDKNGFIWIATQDGLNKYDGNEFITFYSSQFDTSTLSSNTINCLAYDTLNDVIWIGTNNGLNKFDIKKNKITRLKIPQVNRANIFDIIVDKRQEVWFVVKNLGIFHIEEDQINKVISGKADHIFIYKEKLIATNSLTGFSVDLNTKSKERKVEYRNVINIQKDNKNVYFLTKDSLVVYQNGEKKTVNSFLEGIQFSSILVDGDEVWLGSENKGLFLYNLEKNSLQNYVSAINESYSVADNHINTLFKDKTNVIWIGTENNGVSFFDFSKQNIKYLGVKTKTKAGLSSKIIWAISSDEYGNVFIGTNKGLDIYNQYTETHTNHYLDNKVIRALYIKNHILVGADDALYKSELVGDDIVFKNLFKGLERDTLFNNISVYDITEYEPDVFLLGTNNGLLKFDINSLRYKFYNTKNANISGNSVRVVYKDNEMEWWVGTSNGLNKMTSINDTSFEFISFLPANNPASITGEIITSITQDEKNHLWISTYDGAINSFNKNTKSFKNFSVKDGLSNNAVYGILIADGHLWASTNRGISSINLKTKKFKNYYKSDGLQSDEFNTGAYHKTKYGELFFGGVNGVSHFFPSDLKSNTTPPNVGITKILINNHDIQELENYKTINPSYLRTLNLKYDENNIAIHFSSLHFSNPIKNRYKYFIRENEDSTEIVTSNGVANYASLSPGKYTLVIYASNADGYWSEKPLEVIINIEPPFWLTWWFRVLVFSVIGVIVLSLIRFRYRSIKRQKKLLEEIVKRRTETVFKQKEQIEKQKEEIEKEKEKADNVLHKIFPDKIAEKLKNKGKVKAQHYDKVTIVFADFVRFSKISNKLKPEELVSELNRYFKEFDKIIVANRLTQIKTIGDSYMAVGGIPKENKSNAVDAVLVGLHLQELMKKWKERDEKAWQIRVGINTGEIVAGVLETKRPLYDIWGSDVNIASRLQDEGKPGKVNISENTYKLIKPYFNCTPRGGILTKNVGVINMYFVDSIKTELSINGEGIRPSKRFWSYVNLHINNQIKYVELENYFIQFLTKGLPKNLYYHSVDHTIDVVESVERIGLAEGIYDDRLLILKTAALIHDSGFIKQYENNERIGVEYAKEYLPDYGYSKEHIDLICELILATSVSSKPKNKLQRIIKDADLDYLGRSDFQKISDKLFQELNEKGKIKNKEDWDNLQLNFFNEHEYFTKFSINNRAQKKLENLSKIKEQNA